LFDSSTVSGPSSGGLYFFFLIFTSCWLECSQFLHDSDSSYCVGTRRPCIIEPSLLERCRAILNVEGIATSNHDQRMVAEIILYSKLYKLLQRANLSDRRLIGAEGETELKLWREQWDYLFRIDPLCPFYSMPSQERTWQLDPY
jgi:hypothetical protein